MAEDLDAEGRMAVRTPMQWEPTRNGGFSTAPPRRLIQRLVPGGYGPENVNVADQKRNPDSLWSFVSSLTRAYRECPELGWGDFAVVPQPHRQVLAHQCSWEDSSIVAVHNLSAEPVTTRLDLGALGHRAVRLEDVFAQSAIEPGPGGSVDLALDGYDHRWLRVRRESPPAG